MTEQPTRRDFRHTKIICTLGPASDSSQMIESMAGAGMNLARLNMSHGNQEAHLMAIRRIKSLNRKLNHPVSILLDLQGPEIRTGETEEQLHLKVGETISLTVSPEEDPEQKSVHVHYEDLVNDLAVGDRVTVDNGLINLEVLAIDDRQLSCRVLDGGSLGSRKHVNLPGVRVNLPSVTEKDKRDIVFGLEHEVDFIALSFVRSPDDVLEARRILEEADSPNVRLIAKIENQEGVDNFAAILAVSDGIMVARGDLGVEVDVRELPVIQRKIVRACAIAGKPVIVATHLLESMITNPMPTRAEVSDVANAVYEQADAIMLSGETAAGKYPTRCVEALDRIARRIEKEPGIGFYLDRHPSGAREELVRSAVRLADELKAPGIIVFTRRGSLAQLVASFRPEHAIVYAFTNMSSVRRKLWLLRSVVPSSWICRATPRRRSATRSSGCANETSPARRSHGRDERRPGGRSDGHQHPGPRVRVARAGLPDLTAVGSDHRAARLAAERFGELREVGERAVHPPARRRVRVGAGPEASRFLAVLAAPRLGRTEEELLVLGVALGEGALGGPFPHRPVGVERQVDPSEVGDVLAQRQLAVELETRHRLVAGVLLLDALGLFLEALAHSGLPPFFQVTVLVELRPLIVEAEGGSSCPTTIPMPRG